MFWKKKKKISESPQSKNIFPENNNIRQQQIPQTNKIPFRDFKKHSAEIYWRNRWLAQQRQVEKKTFYNQLNNFDLKVKDVLNELEFEKNKKKMELWLKKKNKQN